MKNFIDVEEKLPIGKTIPLSFQHLFAMVGATILVPILTHMNPSIGLFCSGVGTILYILCTKAKLPAYIGSSFAFITPMVTASQNYGPNAMLSGVISAGIVYIIVSTIIRYTGVNWLNKILSPVVVGSVVIVIGLSLASSAIGWAGLDPHQAITSGASRTSWIVVSMVTLAVGVIGSMYFKGFLGVIPILIAIICGYVLALLLGVVPDKTIHTILSAKLFEIPPFMTPKFNINAMIIMAPVSFVTIAEHIGHVYVTNNVVGRDFTKEPGIHRSMLGDGVATIFAGLVGGPPNTTYGENIGVMAITKVYSVWVIGIAAVIAIILSFIGPVASVIANMPRPVMGGVSILLFGIIASSGYRMFVDGKIDFSLKKNLIVTSVIIVLGIGGASINFKFNGSPVVISGVALATIVGIVLNLILPEKSLSERQEEKTA
ncbi:uracil permease [Clostridium acetobutylicum]|uniref:Uracil permease UraA/PyrP n=1 Tax=Clostridium acetobutylicum (strain ATCC 824 / DSM 792 / JCM 1419 / IAM 19013 / LMG 5710 / NBRC 13948 / NRRL B-527 / VKM B-1787 / 2291 / W) TaxID=272562 RepID=Q97HA1_CLOAB|nr:MULTISPECIES: uracil permease [Clostridium]AAK80070.1 Uracil permease UraA/PyrP [Clostridium acetobutylicum ATCC 824]AEI34036.1 Uracil permease UraA/PyrP [Clostridium acetobutylicum DSM 1731]AWV79503.1 uracil permease [Clostridium acetobutylicum]MBC2394524.1 uracil permease [Clostridium acetobutylicum]MBC2583486.1 uracil permease [Clostridium acetobutylicum]